MHAYRQLAMAIAAFAFAISTPIVSFSEEPNAAAIEALIRDGETALAGNRFDEAHARFSEVLRLDWNHPRAYALLQKIRFERDHTLLLWEGEARLAESRNEPGKAKWIYERILGEDSTRADLIDKVRRLGRQRDAADCIRSGMEKFMADDFAGAQLDFEQALTINPKDTLAAQYRERARQKIAASGSLAAIQADPEAWGRYLDALRKLREGELAAAELLWNGLLTKYPGNENIRSNLEQVRRRLGNETAVAKDE